MALETSLEIRSFRGHGSDDLHAIVLGAARVAQGARVDPGAMLALVPRPQPARGVLAIEAQVLDDGPERAIAKLDVRALTPMDEVPRELVLEALHDFGGLAITSISFADPASGRTQSGEDSAKLPPPADALDISVSFAGSIPYLARNVALVEDELTPREHALGAACLRRLGVGFKQARGRLRVSRRQLRARMRALDQSEAFMDLIRAGAEASLYAAPLPPFRSLRLAQRGTPGAPGRKLEVAISRGLRSDVITTPEDTRAVQSFLHRHLGIELADREWEVRSCRWERAAAPDAPDVQTSAS